MARRSYGLVWRYMALLTLGAASAVFSAEGGQNAKDYWPQWRGPLATGVAPRADPPVRWGEGENIRWKTALPGKGHSTPIVWGDRVFVTAAVPFGPVLEPLQSSALDGHDEVPVTQAHRFVVLGLDRRDGSILWQRTVREEVPHAGGHYTASLASPSPVTDGEYLIASFGSYGIYGLDLDGKLLWQADLGPMQPLHGHGEGSSPALYGDTVVVNWDHEGPSFLVALDKRSGEERWRTPRPAGSSWTTPVVVVDGGQPQVIVSGSERVTGYDLASGATLWHSGGLSVENVVASPVAGDGLVYVGSSYDRPAMLAIRYAGARGDITGTERLVWRRVEGASYVPSPLLYGDVLYFIRHFQGVLSRVDARLGRDRPGPLRLGGLRYVFASPVGAAGRVYVSDRDGTTLVLSHGERPEVLASNRLDDGFSASAALAGDALFLRGERYLYCIAAE